MSEEEQETISEVDRIADGLNELLDGTEEINELMTIWAENNKGVKKFKEIDERIRVKLKTYLKERQWNNYLDKESKISIKLDVQKRQTIDKEQLKMMLTDAQYAMVLKTTTFEKMSIVTPEVRKAMKNIIK